MSRVTRKGAKLGPLVLVTQMAWRLGDIYTHKKRLKTRCGATRFGG